MAEEPQTYLTKDLYFGAFLMTAGIRLRETTRKGNSVYFVFEDPKRIDDLRVQYFNRTIKVPALEYANNIKNMKSLTHEVLR